VDALEDPKDYTPFEIAVASDFDAQPAVERELVLRLASLLWRLRRATAIDTGLLRNPSDIDESSDPEITRHANQTSVGVGEIGQFRNEHELRAHEEDSAGQPDPALNADISKLFCG
jgi:hypothetical protein